MNEETTPESRFHRHFASQFFNEAWTLIEKTERTPDDDLRMIHLAHASRQHWEFAGDAQNLSIGEWQISRVYGILGRAEPALYHARNCLRITTEHNLKPFLQAYACEAMARALALAGERNAGEFMAQAQDLAEKIADAHDKAILQADLLTIRLFTPCQIAEKFPGV